MFKHVQERGVLSGIIISLSFITFHGDRVLRDETPLFGGSREDAAVTVEQVCALRARRPKETSNAFDAALSDAHGIRGRRQQTRFELIWHSIR